jgi:hypothetical protein
VILTMSHFAPITDEHLAQARRDPAFRHRLIAQHLENLIAALNLLRKTDSEGDPIKAEQIREGVSLAVRLSNILHRLGK